VNSSGSVIVNTPVNQTYRLRATNDWGWSWHQVTLMYQ
jgi:hypothetical protein